MTLLLALTLFGAASPARAQQQDADPTAPQILTPPPPRTAAIHGPKLFGVRPDSPFLYKIPATGDRPMRFYIRHLPSGLKLNPQNGQITGSLTRAGEYRVTLGVKNSLGTSERPFNIRVGEEIALTPTMGWNSYNVWGAQINAERVLAAAQAMVSSGLDQHGFTYINIDDGWQGQRGGPMNAVQGDLTAFNDMAAVATKVHAMGLKIGIYHTPWVTSYGRRIGGTSENPQGNWDKSLSDGPRNKKILPHAIGKYHFMTPDAKQFANWGMDYLKYDWAPVEAPETKEMHDALRASGRDIVFSLSNNASESLLGEIAGVAPNANSWRTNHDINDQWSTVKRNGFKQDAWAPYARPGHFNDPDMLVVGVVGWGKPHPTRLTPDEQYSHISMWCLSAAPLILGNDLTKLDPFTKGLLTNDEVLDIDQDSLGKQATSIPWSVAPNSDLQVYAKPLEDGSLAVGLFNMGAARSEVTVSWEELGLRGEQSIRDLWRQKNLGEFQGKFSAAVAAHGVVLVKVSPSGRSGH
jgi:alpha-galactosidase